jgi:long-chain acyl-CoA synthetase
LARLTGVSADEIHDETNLYTDLGLDSLMALELLLFLERELNIVIPDEKVVAFQTVGDVLDELRKRGYDRAVEPDPSNGEPRSVLPFSERPPLDRALMGTSFGALKSLFRHYFDLEVENSELLPREGSYILAANHSSHLDTAAVVSALSLVLGVKEAQKMHVIGASDYFFDSQFKGWLFSTFLNVVPIEREEVSLAGLRRVRGILAKGEPILIFPEGTRSRDGTLREFKPGVGLIALELNTPIVPAFIEGTFASLPAGKSVPRKARVKVRFGSRLAMDTYLEAANNISRDEVYRRIARDLRTTIEGLGA